MERFSGIVGVWGGSLDDPGIAFNTKEAWRIFLDDAAPGTVIPPNVSTWHHIASMTLATRLSQHCLLKSWSLRAREYALIAQTHFSSCSSVKGAWLQ